MSELRDILEEIDTDQKISKITLYLDSLKKRLDVVEQKRLRKSGEPKLWPSLDCSITKEERSKL